VAKDVKYLFLACNPLVPDREGIASVAFAPALSPDGRLDLSLGELTGMSEWAGIYLFKAAR
jgi:hypothetical protein